MLHFAQLFFNAEVRPDSNNENNNNNEIDICIKFVFNIAGKTSGNTFLK